MIKRLIAAIASVSAAIAAGVALAVVPRTDAGPSPRLTAEVVAAEPSSSLAPRDPVPEETVYLLGEYNGRVSVLSPATREPEMVFDIFIRTLPDIDQELLRQGIQVSTYEELTRLIEDYIS